MKKRYLRLAALTAGVLLATQTGLSAAALSTFDAAYYAAQYPDVAAVCGNDEGALLRHYLDHGIDHMLALRGDLPFGWTGTNGDLHYATELVKFVRKEFGDKFTIAVAGSPEGHIQCRSLEADIAFLKQKQDEGADYIMTQLCWDMDQFRYWMDAIRAAGHPTATAIIVTDGAGDEVKMLAEGDVAPGTPLFKV